MAIIKTPDQRVRVFISSTINELADERKAAREAINNLRLIPVFFEAGARPHPPRDLYSAYLEQSHIFLGIYWNSYGWVAPGAEISGLEDEYRLCGTKKPKLIYVKKSSERQPKLNDLLSDIEKSDTACYQTFSDATELQKLIENDLSVLMSEIFENAIFDTAQNSSAAIAENIDLKYHRIVELPIIRSEILGREEDIQKVTELLAKPGASLITLLGAGGIGKTTLSIHIADKLKDNFKDGVAFIPLAPVTDFKLVAPTIAEVLGVTDSGKQPIEQTLIDFLSDKHFLLVLDNFEQVVEASKFISDIFIRCKDVKIIITSRTSLHIRNERIYNLAPLALPDENTPVTPDDLNKYPATQLFVERALEVNPRMQFSKENTEAIIEICQRMDGLPLAIELAAARTKFFQPAALMSRIQKTLDLVSKGHKDLPERQQTLRGAIEWSYNLLTEDTQKVFRQLGVFKRSWTIEAADVIANDGSINIEEIIERLLDVSLIKPVLVSHSAEPRFNMLQTVHEYANEMLENAPEAHETKLRYANYFLALCQEADGQLWEQNGDAWLDKLETEYQNIRASFYIFVQTGMLEKAWKFIPLLAPYWTIRGGFSETMKLIADAGINDRTMWDNESISKEVRGRTLTWAGYCTLFLFDFQNGFPMLNKAEEILQKTNDELSLAYAYCFDGCYGSYLSNPDSPQKIETGFVIAERLKENVLQGMWYCWSTEYLRQQGKFDTIYQNLEKAKLISSDTGNTYILAATYLLNLSFALMNPVIDLADMESKAREMYKLFPEKGYKGLKSAALQYLVYGLILQGKTEEAEAPLIRALEYSRLAGEKESEFYGVMQSSYFFKVKNNNEKAYKLFGALDAFIVMANYPIVGGAEAQYNLTKSALEPEWDNPQYKRWYEEGKKINLSDAVIFAMHNS